jgi:hypothetical protein
MRVIMSEQREEDGIVTVRLHFKAREQLLDPGDPSPAARQELSQEAETAIITGFDAVRLKQPAALEILLPSAPDPGDSAAIPEAIRHHLRHVLGEHEREWGIFVRERRASLAFAVFNVLIAIVYSLILSRNEDLMTTVPGILIGAVIVILNWATIWDTYEFFIFGTRERWHRRKLLRKIMGSEIRVIPVS